MVGSGIYFRDHAAGGRVVSRHNEIGKYQYKIYQGGVSYGGLEIEIKLVGNIWPDIVDLDIQWLCGIKDMNTTFDMEL